MRDLLAWPIVIEPGPRPVLELVVSIVVLAGGVGMALLYLRGPKAQQAAGRTAIGGYRPWRRLGAAICLLISIMFVAGLYALNRDTPGKVFFAYWLILALLLMWLCALAVKDMAYTRKVLAAYRAGKIKLSGEPVSRDEAGNDRPGSSEDSAS